MMNSIEFSALCAIQNDIAIPVEDSPATLAHRKRVEEEWKLAAHFIFKRFYDPKHKIPAQPKKLIKKYQPWADLLAREWQLCKECHTGLIVAGMVPDYPHGPAWFQAIAEEAKLNDLSSLPRDATRGSKREDIKDRREIVNALHCRRNPYQPTAPDQIHNYRLIKAALFLCPLPYFNENFYIPYVKAYRAFVNSLHEAKDISATYERNGKLYGQTGKGRGRRLLAG